MSHLVETFCLTLIHSIWQAGLLYALFYIVRLQNKSRPPAETREFLFLLLFGQVILSVSTFFILHQGYAGQLQLSAFSPAAASDGWQVAMQIFMSLYAAVVLYKLGKFSGQLKNLAEYNTGRIKPSVDFRLFTNVKAFEFGIRRKVTLWFSEKVAVPVTYGFFKPVILLPVALANNLSTREVETLIIHELAHIKYKDYFMNILLVLVEILYFFNPFIKLIANKIRLEREKNCDVQVVHYKYAPLSYAETLLKAARFKSENYALEMAAVSNKKHLLNRISFFTDEQNLEYKKGNNSAVHAFLLLVILVVGLFSVTHIRPEIPMNRSSADHPVKDVFSFVAGTTSHERIQPVIKTEEITEDAAMLVKVTPEPANNEEEQVSEVSPELVYQSEEIVEIPETPVYHTMPVAAVETIQKEITITEESSETGETVTRGYKMTYKNGEWITEPLWQMTINKSEADSCATPDAAPIPFHEVQ